MEQQKNQRVLVKFLALSVALAVLTFVLPPLLLPKNWSFLYGVLLVLVIAGVASVKLWPSITPEPLSGRTRLTAWGFAALSGVLLSYSTPPHYLPGLGLIALVPLLLALPRFSATGAFFASYLAGSIYIAANTWWLAQIPAEGGNDYIIKGMFVASVLVRAFSIACAGLVIRWLLTRQWPWAVWLIPFVWLGFEFVHEFDIPGPYPWLSVAYCLAWFDPFIQTADIWGAYGVAASMVFFNVALAAFFKFEGARPALRRGAELKLAMPIAATALAVYGMLYGVLQIRHYDALERDDGPLVGLVQGNMDQEVKVDEDPILIRKAFMEHVKLTRRAISEGAELVVWPESMVMRGATRDGHYIWAPDASRELFKDGVPSEKLLRNEEYKEFYIARLRAHIYHELKTPMLVGVVTEIPPDEQDEEWKSYTLRRHNSAMLLDAQGKVAGIHDKFNLVPGGENIPNEGNPVIRYIAGHYSEELQGSISMIEKGRQRTRFEMPSQTPRLRRQPWKFTTTICYEYAFPRTHAFLEATGGSYQRPDFHINISNEGWFKSSSELDQAVVMSRFRAIETRTPMLRCTNTGVTCNIDACGRVRETLTVDGNDRLKQGVLVTRPHVIERDYHDTIFTGLNVRRSPVYLFAWGNIALLALMFVGRVRAFFARTPKVSEVGTSDRVGGGN